MNSVSLEKKRIAWVIHTFRSGGIAPVCGYAAEEMANFIGCVSTVIALHDRERYSACASKNVRSVGLGLPLDGAEGFLDWLQSNPQDIVITNDVGTLEKCFCSFPDGVIHIAQLHDSGRRYLESVKRNLVHLDGVVCVASNVERAFRSVLTEQSVKPICTVHNGAKFPPLARGPYDERSIRLLYMGRLDPLIKGVFDVVPVLESLRRLEVPFKLTIVGGGCGVLSARLRKAKLDGSVVWLGRLPHEECYAVAANHDIFLMTSRKEPFGMVTIEAMAMGCIPIAHDIDSGSREIIEHGTSGFLMPLGDYNSWGSAISNLASQPVERERVSVNASSRARLEFSSEKMARKLSDYLLSVSSSRRAALSGDKVCFEKGGQEVKFGSPRRLVLSKLKSLVRNSIAANPRLSVWLLRRFG